MTDEFFEDENVDNGENNLEYDRDIFDIEIEFDDEVVKRYEFISKQKNNRCLLQQRLFENLVLFFI